MNALAIFSDVHSNLEALQAVLDDMGGITRRFCLGDTVGYAADPARCVEIVQALECPVLMGNHDQAAATNMPLEGMNASAQAGIEFSRQNLTPPQRSWLASLPLSLEQDECLFVHGSLFDPWEYVIDPEDAFLHFSEQTEPLSFCGHTHRPMVWHLDDHDHLTFQLGVGRVRLPKEGKTLVNVGSVGQPRDFNPDACYVIHDTKNHEVEFRRVPYDIAKAHDKILHARLPRFTAHRLAEGR